MGEKKVVDLSRFFLYEAAGDSEVYFDHTNLVSSCGVADDRGNNIDVDIDVDDAESCSDETHYRNAQLDILERGRTSEDDDDKLDDGIVHDCEGSDPRYCIDDGDHCHHGYGYHCGDRRHHGRDDEMVSSEVTSTANSYASRKCACSRKRKMSEIEKSRLFWEACLAS